MRLFLTVVCFSCVLACTGKKSAPTLSEKSMSEDQKVLYTLGQLLGRNVTNFRLTEDEMTYVVEGFKDIAQDKKSVVDMGEYSGKIRTWAQARKEKLKDVIAKETEDEKKKGKEYLEKIAKEKDSKKLPSGVVYKVIKEGTGEFPKASDRVKVHYHGTLIDGTVFDSSVKRGNPIDFSLRGVIKCWSEGMQKINKGGKIKLFCPSDLAYGDRGSPPKIKPGATLVFEVELLEIMGAPKPPQGLPQDLGKAAAKEAPKKETPKKEAPKK